MFWWKFQIGTPLKRKLEHRKCFGQAIFTISVDTNEWSIHIFCRLTNKCSHEFNENRPLMRNHLILNQFVILDIQKSMLYCNTIQNYTGISAYSNIFKIIPDHQPSHAKIKIVTHAWFKYDLMRLYKLCCWPLKTNNGPHNSIYALSYFVILDITFNDCLLKYWGCNPEYWNRWTIFFLMEYHHYLPWMHDVIKTISIGSRYPIQCIYWIYSVVIALATNRMICADYIFGLLLCLYNVLM